VHFQLGACTPQNSAIALLLGSLISVPAFETLRTKEQLGYLVSASSSSTGSGCAQSLRLSVQSALASCDHIQARIAAFLDAFPAVLQGMGEAGVREKARVLAARVREPSKTPNEDFWGVWGQVSCGALEWGAMDAKAAVIESLSLQQLLGVWQEGVQEGGGRRRRLVVRVHAQAQQGEGAAAGGGLLGGGPSARPLDPPSTAVHITSEAEAEALKGKWWEGRESSAVQWIPGRGALAFLPL